MPLVLASASKTRLELLTGAGVPVEVCVSHLDERQIVAGLRGTAVNDSRETYDAGQLACHLAQAKAAAVAAVKPGRLVLASDQTLELDGHLLHKPDSRDAAIAQMTLLSGRTHRLHAAMTLWRGGQHVESAVSSASLTMRVLSQDFIAAYVEATTPGIFTCVGGYQLESLGIQLFEHIEGDHFTILGLPLLKVLAALRRQDALSQ